MFCFKDARFGCLSKAAAIAIYTFDNISDYLEQFPDINNRLACLVMEVMDLPYLKAVLVVWAFLGLHHVGPFYAITIQEGTTHGSLAASYKGLCSSMAKHVDMEFFSCARPMLDGVGQDLFTGVKENYGQEVVEAVVTMTVHHKEEVIKRWQI